MTLKVKFADYQQITRSRTFTSSINSLDVIITQAMVVRVTSRREDPPSAIALFEAIELEDKSIRLLGISISNLDNEELKIVQLSLFSFTN